MFITELDTVSLKIIIIIIIIIKENYALSIYITCLLVVTQSSLILKQMKIIYI